MKNQTSRLNTLQFSLNHVSNSCLETGCLNFPATTEKYMVCEKHTFRSLPLQSFESINHHDSAFRCNVSLKYSNDLSLLENLELVQQRQKEIRLQNTCKMLVYEGWNFNSGNYLFTTDTK